MSVKGNRFFGTVPLSTAALLLTWLATSAISAELPGPYIADLDKTSHVVVGTIAAIEKAADKSKFPANNVDWGIATVQVREVLKGPDLKTLKCAVMIPDPPVTNSGVGVANQTRGPFDPLRQEFQPKSSEIPIVHRTGDSGIWLVDSNGIIMWDFGLVKERDLENVKLALGVLEKRKWSEPVNGLQAWAVAVNTSGEFYRNGFYGSRTGGPEITLAVRNVSQSNLYVPHSPDFIHATITSDRGTTTNLNLSHKAAFGGREIIPGGIAYLVSFGQSELQKGIPYVDLLDNLGPGKYTATVECHNSQPGDALWLDNAPAWTGQLTAPKVEFEISIPDALCSPSPSTREAAAKIARETFVPTSRSKWTSLTNQLAFGLSMSNVVELLEKREAHLETISSIGNERDSWTFRLDDTWILDIQFAGRDSPDPYKQGQRMLISSKLETQIQSFPVSPPSNFTGVWKTYYANGQIAAEQSCKDGKLQGSHTPSPYESEIRPIMPVRQ